MEKTLACGDTGTGAMAHVEEIVKIVGIHIDRFEKDRQSFVVSDL